MKQKLISKRAALKFISGAVLATSIAAPAAAELDHSNLITCYAYVHGQCYGNGQNNCSTEDYNWGLDQCDGYYPQAQVVKPKGKLGLATKTSKRSTVMSIKRSFRKQ